MKKSVLGIGNALVDILTRIDNDNILKELNLPKGSMQHVDAAASANVGQTVGQYESTMAPGGSSANTIHGLAKCGIPTGFIFSTGNDEMGRFFEDAMKEVGVKPIVYHRNAHTGTARAIISPDGERTFATHLGAAVELTADLLRKEIFEGWDYCYIEGYLIMNQDLVRKTIELSKQAGCKVAIDLASYNVVEANRDFLLEILPQIDIVFANEEEAKSLTGSTPEESLEFIAEHCEIAVVKIGKRGSLIKRGGEKVQIGCNKVNVIDTTGAGDMYAAGFMAGLINGLSLGQCGELGNCLAESIIQVVGAKMDEGRWNAIYEKFPMLKNNSK
ncbi:MAG: adenosine kinase [Bacteroidales bacterium]|nr:adenosine kinase [Bacteroidales bacterium]MCQ2316493.1 adenosine kinase [Bacteroidales bacterium]